MVAEGEDPHLGADNDGVESVFEDRERVLISKENLKSVPTCYSPSLCAVSFEITKEFSVARTKCEKLTGTQEF